MCPNFSRPWSSACASFNRACVSPAFGLEEKLRDFWKVWAFPCRFLALSLFEGTALTFVAQSPVHNTALQGTTFSEHLISACPANKSSALFLHVGNNSKQIAGSSWALIPGRHPAVPPSSTQGWAGSGLPLGGDKVMWQGMSLGSCRAWWALQACLERDWEKWGHVCC